jgi:hypothetical protein
MKYYDIYITVEGDSKEGYSVFIDAEDEKTAVAKLKSENLCEDPDDVNHIKAITPISLTQFCQEKGIPVPTRTLDVTCTCQAYYTSSIEVPADFTLKQAIEYAKDHIRDIPIQSSLEYVSESDELDEENCEFDNHCPDM